MEQLALGWVLLASTLFGTAATGSRRDVRAITEKVMDMAQDSFDDQYQDCRTEMEEKLKTVNRTEFQNKAYADTWRRAAKHWQKQWGNSNRPQVLPQEQAVAVLAYTDKGDLSKQLNTAMLEGGRSHEDYLESFPFKTLHFLLTEALHTLRKTQSPKCNSVYRGTTDRFTAQLNEHVRFGQFTSTSLQKEVAESFGQHTFFFVNTCYGVSIRSFSFRPEQEEVLIPPYEVFKVTNVIHHTEGTHIHLDSHSTHSNYKCALVKEKRCKAQPCVFSAGTSSPREPPHLWSLLLAAAALAAVGCL
ncbi:erythroblast NAD(P)(+)--arginine ADP-ribosyltransferase-like isoform X1 [Anas acuta]|uniref:erythroblast NAD(P)(+)--arginine ADP-ribosyltransferase-like isoform X1 n=1 Tax=Anas acuta TaxID=28680 RepID=UPI0035C8CC06